MQLASNVPSTVFSMREARVDALPEEDWQLVGEGELVIASLPNGQIEISAMAPGYREKRVRLTEPVKRYEFKFLEADRKVSAGVDPERPGTQGKGPPSQVADKQPDVPPFTDQRHALIVGISTYQSSDFQSLQNARRDAEALAEFLKSPEGGNIASLRIHLLLDDQATHAQIIDKLMQMAREANEGDLIILYFAGHARVQGGGEQSARFLMPFDAVAGNPWGTAIDRSFLVNMLDHAVPHRQLLLLDCCYAGGPTVRGEVENVWGSLSARARVVLTSTKGDETAWDGDRRSKTGPFATQVIRALSGALPADKDDDGRLTVQELFDAIGPQVRLEAKNAGHEMTPQLFGDWADKIEIARAR